MDLGRPLMRKSDYPYKEIYVISSGDQECRPEAKPDAPTVRAIKMQVRFDTMFMQQLKLLRLQWIPIWHIHPEVHLLSQLHSY